VIYRLQSRFAVQLPNYILKVQRCKKLQYAISNENGTCHIFYVSPEVIDRFGFPDWFRGCNSINKPHPTVVRVIEERKLKPHHYISSYIVKKKTLFTLLEEEGIRQMFMLKIDTEGHDCIILDKYIDDISGNSNGRLPYLLYFETNILHLLTFQTPIK